MSEISSKSLPRWFWFAAAAALVWNLLGVMAFVSDITMSADTVAQLPEAQQEMRARTPAFVYAAYGLAVFAGAFGSMFLLLKQHWAVTAYTASFIALLVQFGYTFLAGNVIASFGVIAVVLPAMTIIIGLLLLRFSMSARRRGWLK